MKRYWIKYKLSTSEVESYSVKCSENELEEQLQEILFNCEAMITWIGDKPEGQRDYYESDKFSILTQFGLLNKQQENEDKIYEEWGY